ncbi:hypothetical protein HPB50_008625 [Hyalomma asiaticum]|uniref:Uncharacterized protein n=1 Tax=Hyalomma asiaticum TaxID=266040 RepID=A0ACB7S174_HYAAI|nr:hypothetical protein HPB50_008625 [Hyalomma asiaticum]
MSHLLAENEYYNEESKTEFQSAKDKPGIHIYNPKTPVELHLPGGIQKFNDVFMESTFRKDMKTVTFEYWWSARMDMPLLELVTEQLRPGVLNYTLDDYELRRYTVPEFNYKFEPGKTHQLQFHLGMEKGMPLYSIVRYIGITAENHDARSHLHAVEIAQHRSVERVVYEWWWSKTMDFPLFEVTSEQYMENKLQYYVEDYNSKSKDVGNRDFYYVLGQDTRTKFLYDVKDRYLVIRIDGRYSLFELLDRYADASPYDRFYIKGDLDIKVIRIPYADPLPVPLSLPLTSSGILKGDRYEIKGKNPRNAESFRLVFGDQSLEVPLGVEHEEFALEVTGEEDGRCTAKLNDVELPGVISKGPFLTDRMVLEGDVDFNWVIITKPGGSEAAIGDGKENESPKEEAKEKTKEKEKSAK